MNGLHRTICVGLMFGSLLAGGQVWAGEGEREVAAEINEANGLLRSGDVDGAVKAYQQVQGKASDRADLSYNMAVAQYRKGDMAAAEQLFNQVASAEDDALAAKARYNLGNCNYAAALRSAETDHPAAIKSLEKAIENYRSALEVDSNDADSRANIELASTMIDKLREQEKKQQQQQQQKQQQDQKKQDNKDSKDQQSKDQNDQKQENSKQQENQEKKDSQQQQGKGQQQSQEKQEQKPDSSKENKSQGEQGSQDQQQKKDEKSKEKSGEQSQEQKSQQKESKSEHKDSKSESQEQKANSADQKQQPKQDQAQAAPDKPQDKSAADKQAEQSQTLSKQKPKDQRPEPADAKQSEQAKDQQGSAAPKGALSAADKKAGKADPQGKELAGKSEVVKEGEMTVQEAEKMLQAIRDQEMIRRLKRQATERNQHVPVDRDW